MANPTHTYATAGTYNVTLTVTDNDAATTSATTTATIQPEQTGGGAVANACAAEGPTSGRVDANDDMCVPTDWANESSYNLKSENAGNTESITVNNSGSGYRYFSIVGQHSVMAVKVEFQ